MEKRISERIKVLNPIITGYAASYHQLKNTLRRAVDAHDSTGYLAFDNSDAGRSPYNPDARADVFRGAIPRKDHS